MTTTYAQVEDVSSDASDDDAPIEDVMDADVELQSVTRRDRCLDFWFCRRNAATMLVVLDVAFLASTLWNYSDMIVVMIAARVLGVGGDSWFYAVLAVPVFLQLYAIVFRIRYAISTPTAHADIDWQMRYITRPYTLSMINGLAAEVYLLLLPLLAPVLLDGAGVTSFSSFGELWARAMMQPSQIIFTILFFLEFICNWRVANKHYWRVKLYVAQLQAKALAHNRGIEMRMIAETNRSATPIDAPAQNEPLSPKMRKSGLTTHTVMFVPDADNNDKPTGAAARSKRKPRGHRSRRNKLATQSSADQPSLDRSVHSQDDGEKWR